MKNIGFIFVWTICILVAASLVWKFGFSREETYIRPLRRLVEHAFGPRVDTEPEVQIDKIRDYKARSARSIKAGTGNGRVDRMTVYLCDTLLTVYARRPTYHKRIAAAQASKYRTLSGDKSAEKKKLFIESLHRSQKNWEQEQETLCNSLIRRMRQEE